MGYDMYTVGAEACTSLEHRDHYLQRALGNGYHLAVALVDAGMGSWGPDDVWQAAEDAGWPHPPEGVEYFYDEATGTDGYRGKGAEAYLAALEAYLRDRRGAPRGIAVYKLCNTNDGWWVTQQECQEAMEAYHANGRVLTARNDVIPFIQAGADHDGFRVR